MMPNDLYEDLAARIAEHGGAAEIGGLASEFLRVADGPLARRVFGDLLAADPRFLCEAGLVHLNAWDHGLHAKRLAEVTFAVLDFETNGLCPGDRAIEIGLSCWRNAEEIASYESLVDPGTGVSPFVTRLTGIREQDLRGRPVFEDILPEVVRLLEGAVVVAHNLPFDRRILLTELDRAGGDRRLAEPGICTLKLARRLLPKKESKRLDALADRFGLRFEARHRALGDARVTGALLWILLGLAAEEAPMETFGEFEAFLHRTTHRAGAALLRQGSHR